MTSGKKARKKRVKNRRRQDLVAPTKVSRARVSGWLIASFLCAVSAVALYAVGSTAQTAIAEIVDRPIAAIEIKAEMEQVSESEIKAIVQPLVGKPFLSVDLEVLKREIEQHPWIAKASLSRRWPDRLHVALSEETAIARWRETGFLNQAGDEIVLGENGMLTHLPKLSGPENSQPEVAKKFVEINAMLKPLKINVKTMQLNDDLSWQVALSNGLFVKLGRDQLLDKIERFVAVYTTTLEPRLVEIESVDLRYRNGVAVKWIEQEISAAN